MQFSNTTCAISGTSGSSGFASVNNEQMDKRTFIYAAMPQTVNLIEKSQINYLKNITKERYTLDIVSAGDHCSFKISKQMPPLLLILQ